MLCRGCELTLVCSADTQKSQSNCKWSLRPNIDTVHHGNLSTDWAWDCYQEGKLDVFLENDSEALNDYKRLMTFVKVGLWCVQENPSMRPTMRNVI
ncbi:putative non-specific serine/threonine protein kinase [Helianthus anomalus]